MCGSSLQQRHQCSVCGIHETIVVVCLNSTDHGRNIGMDSYLKSRVWSMQYGLAKVQAALIDNEMMDTEKHMRKYTEVLRYFSLLSDLPSITSVTGAQGVGKSYHVNQMCELPSEQRTLSILGRGEVIPVILMQRNPKLTYNVRLYKRTTPSGSGMFEFEDLTYDEARKRVEKPESDDLCAFWQADGNSVLATLSPIAVLPGFEYRTPWASAINIILDLSNAVIYVTDPSRAAMEVSAILERKLKELQLQYPPLILLSKTDAMSKEQLKQFASNFNYQSIPVGFVAETIPSDPERIICTQKQYDPLIEVVGKLASERPTTVKLDALESAINGVMMYLREAREQIDQQTVASGANIERAIKAYIEEYDRIWDNLIRRRILDKVEETCSRAASEACKAAQPVIESNFDSMGDRIKNWFKGGVTLHMVNELQEALGTRFKEVVQTLNTDSLRLLEEKSNELSMRLNELGDEDFRQLITTGRELILVNTMHASPLTKKSIDETIRTDLTSILQAGAGVIQGTSGLMNGGRETMDKVRPIVEAIGRDKGRKAIFAEIQKLPDKQKAQQLQELLSGGLGAGGAAMSGAEIAGAGFTGATMSVVAGVVGGALVALAAGGWLMSVTRTANKTEWMLDDLAKRTARAMQDLTVDSISTSLDRFWEGYKFQLRQVLLSDTGLAGQEKNTIILAGTTHAALEESKNLIQAIALANGL